MSLQGGTGKEQRSPDKSRERILDLQINNDNTQNVLLFETTNSITNKSTIRLNSPRYRQMRIGGRSTIDLSDN